MTARDDGYVECSECGHRIEGHTIGGCEEVAECGCRVRWTRAEIRAVRRREGLPGRWETA